jgi:integrase
MFPTSPPRPSASRSSARASALSRQVAPPPPGGPETASACDPSGWTLRELERRFEDFLDHARHVEGKSPDTLRGYRGVFALFRRFLTEGQRAVPPKVGPRFFAIEEFVAWNNRRGVSAITTNHYWRSLRPFFHDLEKRDGLFNPFRGMRPPVTPTPIPKARSLEECRRILVAADNFPWASAFERRRAVALLATAMYAGLRKGELLRLTFTDIDLDEGTILVRSGKGRGGGKDRVVFVAPELREVLEHFVRERGIARVVAPGFWASPIGGDTMSEAALKRAVTRVRRASGIAFSLHSLRHSFVTLLLRAGVPIHVVRDLAGHTSIVTTAGYLRVWDEDKRRGVERLSLQGLTARRRG